MFSVGFDVICEEKLQNKTERNKSNIKKVHNLANKNVPVRLSDPIQLNAIVMSTWIMVRPGAPYVSIYVLVVVGGYEF